MVRTPRNADRDATPVRPAARCPTARGRMTAMSEGHHEDHGHSVAAWTAVGIILLAATIMSWAVIVASIPLFVVGSVLVVVGVIAGKALTMAGFGNKARQSG